MSTDWIKMRVDLRSHPKVVVMSSALRADKLRSIGGLFAVWAIFDAHSIDGILDGYTFRAIDEELHWKGFAKAMSDIGWLIDLDGHGLEAPRFDEHNGQSAKRRAMEAERKRLDREAEKETAKAGQTSASDADKKRTREEKRREETKPSASSAKAPTIPCPYDQIVASYHGALPSLPRVKLMQSPRQKALRKAWGWVLSSTRSDGTRRATTAEEAIEWFRGYFVRAGENDFLMGRSPRSAEHANWQCDIDFLLSDKGMKLVIEKTEKAV